MSDKPDGRPGEQPAPVPNDGPSMHDLVCEDLWRGGAAGKTEDAVIADMQARKQFGLKKYGTLLQANNGHDALLDLYEELQDAAVYARQVLEEGRIMPVLAGHVCSELLDILVLVRKLRDDLS